MRGVYSSAKHHARTSSEMVFLYRFSIDAGLNFGKLAFQMKAPGSTQKQHTLTLIII